MARPEKEKDVRGLADDELAALEKRTCEWRMLDAFAVEKGHHCGHAAPAGLAGHVDIVRAALLERKANKLAAPLYGGPVVQFIAHSGQPPFSSGTIHRQQKPKPTDGAGTILA